MTHRGGRVYGPVPSRRLGASLGVDVVPMKVCPYDCVYCQLGATRELTRTRRQFFPAEEVLAEVEERLRRWPPPEVITIAGSGEPTLYAGLGEVIDGIKGMTDIPVALLTNGALFCRPDVRSEAARADLVLPSLDAGDEETFRMVNRPVSGLTLEGVVDGLAEFRRSYGGKIWLEVMVLAGITEMPDRIRAIARLATRIAPDRIQLNTPVRPTFNEDAAPVTAGRLAELSRMFTPEAEVIAEWGGRHRDGAARRAPESDSILALLQRRPCTVDDVAGGLDLHPNTVLKGLGVLERDGKVHRVLRDGHVFWHAIQASPRGPRRSAR